MNCPIGYGLGACPVCCYNKNPCDYPFVIGQPGQNGKPVAQMQREAAEFVRLARDKGARRG